MPFIPASQPAAERLQIVTSFLDGLPSDDAEHAQIVACEIAGRKPLANTVVVIPIAVHQEASQIVPAMSQYARQLETAEPFSLVLNLNCPTSEANSAGIQATMDEFDKVHTEFPELDIRSFFRTYDEPRQGRIRRDAWNGVLRAAVLHDQIDEQQSVVILNQDIDLMRLRSGSIAAVQRDYDHLTQEGLVLPIGAIHMRHGKSPAHPNIATAVAWSDYLFRMGSIAFEPAFVIPAEMYASFGGFRPTTRIGEVAKVTHDPHFFVRGAHATTSPRRYLDRIHDDGYDIWKVETFSATDRCRVATDGSPDISRGDALRLIEGTLERTTKDLSDAVLRSVLRDYTQLSRQHPDAFKELTLNSKSIEDAMDRKAQQLTRVTFYVLRTLTGDDKIGEKLCSRVSTDYSDRAAVALRMLTAPTQDDLEQLARFIPLR